MPLARSMTRGPAVKGLVACRFGPAGHLADEAADQMALSSFPVYLYTYFQAVKRMDTAGRQGEMQS